MGRTPCCEKVGLRRGRWTAEEDEALRKYIEANGEGSWRSLPKNAGLLRCGKSCRLRWINYLRPNLKRGNITAQEEDIIINLHASLKNRWSVIAAHLPGRTDNEIKNYWNSHLSRKILPSRFRRPNPSFIPPPQIVQNSIAKRISSRKRPMAKNNKAKVHTNHEAHHQAGGSGISSSEDTQLDRPLIITEDEMGSLITDQIGELCLEEIMADLDGLWTTLDDDVDEDQTIHQGILNESTVHGISGTTAEEGSSSTTNGNYNYHGKTLLELNYGNNNNSNINGFETMNNNSSYEKALSPAWIWDDDDVDSSEKCTSIVDWLLSESSS